MSSAVPFQASGPNTTVNVAVTAGSQNLAVKNGLDAIRIVNSGVNTIFLEINAANQTASLTTSMPMLPNTVEVFNAPLNSVISVISTATGNTLYATPGVGL